MKYRIIQNETGKYRVQFRRYMWWETQCTWSMGVNWGPEEYYSLLAARNRVIELQEIELHKKKDSIWKQVWP